MAYCRVHNYDESMPVSQVFGPGDCLGLRELAILEASPIETIDASTFSKSRDIKLIKSYRYLFSMLP